MKSKRKRRRERAEREETEERGSEPSCREKCRRKQEGQITKACTRLPLNVLHTLHMSLSHHIGFIQAVAARVREGLAKFPEEDRDKVVILFSAHSLPIKIVNRGDPYPGTYVTEKSKGAREKEKRGVERETFVNKGKGGGEGREGGGRKKL